MGAGTNIISSVAGVGWGAIGDRAAINKQNATNLAQWEENVELTQHMIGTLAYRTSQEQADIKRDKINAIIATKKAVRQKEGDQAVVAAQMGAEGRRPERLLKYGVSREGADAVTDAELTEEIELRNSTTRYNDTAQQMLDSLNAARPSYQSKPSMLSYALTLGGTGASAYAESSPSERAQFGSSMRGLFTQNTTTTSEYTGDSFESFGTKNTEIIA